MSCCGPKEDTVISEEVICRCEVISAPPPFSCDKKIALVIALEASVNVTPEDFTLAKEFVLQLARVLERKGQFGFLTFSDQPEHVVDLDQGLSWPEIYRTINSTPQRGNEGRATDFGIDESAYLLSSSNPGTTKKMVIVTVGVSDNPTETEAAAAHARTEGIILLSVGVGDFDPAELETIAGGIQENVFAVEGFNLLQSDVTPNLISKICE